MHPILGQLRRLIAYLLSWLPLSAMLVYLLAVPGGLTWMEAFALGIPLCLLYGFMCLSAWYSCRWTPLDRAGALQVAFTHLLGAIVVSGIWILSAKALAHELSGFSAFNGLEPRLSKNLPLLFGTGILLYLLAVAFFYVLLAVQQSQEAKEREMKAGVLARDAELRALKAQVNPHFLFNSLNSISALTSIDPAKAREMCIRLSDFLRNSLRLGERASIPFGEELALTGTYLDVEQVRFGQRLRVKQDFEPACAACEVPPLLVQPLVENAIKHGIATLTDGGEIAMSARVHQDRLRFIVENPFDPDAPAQKKSGFGLVNVRNRLNARYGSAAKLDIQVEQGIYRVVLSMPCGGKSV
jgi:two-component system sensor histidine kinase AlgZ